MVRTTVISHDLAIVTVPWTTVTLAHASFQLLIEARNDQQPELIYEFYIRDGRPLISTATIILAVAPAKVGHDKAEIKKANVM